VCAELKKSKLQLKGDFHQTMSSPTLDRSMFSADLVSQTNPPTCPKEAVEHWADSVITARAVVAVTLLGAGIWYLLWTLALHFEAGR
jgi:hypothetical protein